MSKMNPVVHFEMPAEDKKRMANFYTNVFGWQMQQLGPEMGDYIVVTTSEVGEDHFPKQRGTINGGFYQKTKDMGEQHPLVVISVEDIRKSMKKVKEAGGKILGGDPNKPGEPGDIPGIGLYCSFIDTEGNRISMLQPSQRM
jgi:predicted enzyme related to lactoylglutathione lyase